MSLWKKELIKKILFRTFFIFISVFLLYSLVDFSINSIRFSSAKTVDLFKYYLMQTSFYLDIFLPISFLISMIKTLNEMNVNREFLILFTSGLSKNKFFSPLLLIAFFFSIICLYNIEFLIPKTSDFVNDFQEKICATKKRNSKKNINSILLSDSTHLIFSKYDPDEKTLEDVFWIKNFEDIWHIERISLSHPLKRYFLDHFVREQNDRLVKADSYKDLIINDLPITEDEIKDSLIPLNQKSITKLLINEKKESLEIVAEKKTLASVRLIFSFSFIWIVICLSPFCIKFSRSFSPIFILGVSIFCFICFYTIITALSVLCINQVISCSLALWFPSILMLLFGAYNILRKANG